MKPLSLAPGFLGLCLPKSTKCYLTLLKMAAISCPLDHYCGGSHFPTSSPAHGIFLHSNFCHSEICKVVYFFKLRVGYTTVTPTPFQPLCCQPLLCFSEPSSHIFFFCCWYSDHDVLYPGIIPGMRVLSRQAFWLIPL